MLPAFLPSIRRGGVCLVAALAFAPAPPTRAAAAPPVREAGLPFVQLFQRRDYRGHALVSAGAVDARGLLYFANYAQILVYDGVQWDRIAVPGATFVRSLAVDPAGRLWVAATGALGYVDTTAPRPAFVSLNDRLPANASAPGDLQRVHVTNDGVFFRSSTRLLRWRADQFEAWPLTGFGPWQSLVLEGRLALQNPAQGWRQIGPNGPELFDHPMPQIPPLRVALPWADGQTLIGAMRIGFGIYANGTISALASDASDFFSNHILFKGTRLTDGRYAMASINGGASLYSHDLTLEMLVDESSGLPSSTVNDVLHDGRGGLWLGLDDGIARVDDSSACTWFRVPTPLGRIDMFALDRFAGRLVLGTDRELAHLTPSDDGFAPATWSRATETVSVLSGLLATDDTLLLATRDGCYPYRDKKIGARLGPSRAYGGLLRSATQPNRIFLSHENGIDLLRRDEKGWKADGSLAGFSAAVEQLFEDADGSLWAATPTGAVWHLASTDRATPRFELFDSAHGLPAAKTALQVTRAGGRPLFVTARGLYRYDPARRRFDPELRYGARFADGSTEVRALVEDARGALWIAPRHGADSSTWSETTLGRAQPDGTWQPLPVADLTRIGDINGFRLESEGGREVLWAVGVSGILRVDLAAVRPPPDAGATLVREVTTLATDASLLTGRTAAPHLAYAQNALRFRVAAPGLAGRPERQFETELIGLSGGTRLLSASTTREFIHLFEGRYVFRARARAADGRWTTPAEFAFVILPPWWRTTWAYTLWGSLIVAAIAGLVTLRTRSLRQRASALETIVAERTAELHARNVELTRLHQLELDEKTTARLAEEKTRLEMLRYQLNPHFLFNTLNSLYALVDNHPAAGDMVLRLSEFCRLTLTRGADHAQTLDEELTILTTYLDIEKVRWGDGLRVTVDAEPAARAVRLPPFLLLPLVENAIKHGGETSRDVLQLRLIARRVATGLEIEIANTGRWLAPGTSPARSTHIGLENLRERLRRTYPDAHEFTTAERDGWVIVTLRIADTGNRISPVNGVV